MRYLATTSDGRVIGLHRENAGVYESYSSKRGWRATSFAVDLFHGVSDYDGVEVPEDEVEGIIASFQATV